MRKSWSLVDPSTLAVFNTAVLESVPSLSTVSSCRHQTCSNYKVTHTNVKAYIWNLNTLETQNIYLKVIHILLSCNECNKLTFMNLKVVPIVGKR